MELKNGQLILDQDAELDAVNALTSRIAGKPAQENMPAADRQKVERNTQLAASIGERVTQVIMGKPSFENPHVVLSPAETELLLETVYKGDYTEISHATNPPHIKRALTEIAEKANQYYHPTSVVLE